MSAECLHISAYTDLQTDHSLFECLYGLCVFSDYHKTTFKFPTIQQMIQSLEQLANMTFYSALAFVNTWKCLDLVGPESNKLGQGNKSRPINGQHLF